MYAIKKTILLAALLSTGSSWVLKSTHTNVIPKLTDDVTLQCHCEILENPGCKLDQLTRIRLLKRNDAGNYMSLAEISVPDNSNVSFPHSVNSTIVASGHLGTSNESFLSITWPTATDNTVGSYKCEIDGFGGEFRSDVDLSTQAVHITGFIPKATDLVDIMIKMKQEMQSKIEDNFLEVRYWPEGNYSLLSPVSGCPDTPYNKMVRGFAKLSTETIQKPNNSLSNPSHLPPDVFERCDSRNIFLFRFCRSRFPEDQVLMWPKGSYCINLINWPECPRGFKVGGIYSDLELSSPIELTVENIGFTMWRRTDTDMVNFYFCCRNDGDPNVPVVLPNSMPFYLYRYKGQCQKVRNMDVADEWIQLDTGSNDEFYQEHPDGQLNDVTIRMCYYSKRK